MTGIYIVMWLVGLTVTTLIGAEVVKRARGYGWGILTSFLAAYLIVNMVLVPRLISIPHISLLGVSAIVVSGTIFWPFITNITDMINEIYGRKKAYIAAGVGFLGRIIFVIFIVMAMTSDPFLTEKWTAETEAWWQSYFAMTGRVMLAALGSYAIQQFFNIHIFANLKSKWRHIETTPGKRVKFGILRSWASDTVDILVDSPTFYVFAFAWVLPWPLIATLTVSAIVIKLLISQVNQPFYALFRWRTHNVEREY